MKNNSLIRESNGYTEVLLYDGRIGYVKTSTLSTFTTEYNIEEEISLRNNIVRTALEYIGTQYR